MKTRMHRTYSNKPICFECEDNSDIAVIKRVYRSDTVDAVRRPSQDYFLCEHCIQESVHVWIERSSASV